MPLNEFTQPYDNGYDYGYGKDGSTDTDGDGRKNIDCSHLVHELMRKAGYSNYKYLPTAELMRLPGDSHFFNEVSLDEMMPGDVLVWKYPGHTGVVTGYDKTTGQGTYYGSQRSTGPKQAGFDTNKGQESGVGKYWPKPSRVLRPKPVSETTR